MRKKRKTIGKRFALHTNANNSFTKTLIRSIAGWTDSTAVLHSVSDNKKYKVFFAIIVKNPCNTNIYNGSMYQQRRMLLISTIKAVLQVNCMIFGREALSGYSIFRLGPNNNALNQL